MELCTLRKKLFFASTLFSLRRRNPDIGLILVLFFHIYVQANIPGNVVMFWILELPIKWMMLVSLKNCISSLDHIGCSNEISIDDDCRLSVKYTAETWEINSKYLFVVAETMFLFSTDWDYVNNCFWHWSFDKEIEKEIKDKTWRVGKKSTHALTHR